MFQQNLARACCPNPRGIRRFLTRATLPGFPGTALIVALLLAFFPPSAFALIFQPDGPPLCEANLEDSGGQNASTDMATNKAFSRADGGFLTQHSSHASVGVLFTSTASFPATIQMGVTYAGRLVGSLGTNSIFGEVKIRVRLRNETENLELDSVTILDKKQDGAAFQTIFEVVASDQFNPPVATFANLDLKGGHDYSVTLEVATKAKGLQGESDFKDQGSVSFGCVAITADLLDSDGDGLFDIWEQDGIDVDGDNLVDLDLPSMGARWDHKDLFLEMDWRTGKQPLLAEIQAMKTMFSLAPVDAGGTSNPDGQPGINLWVDTGGLMENGMLVGDDFGGGNEILDPVICLDDSFYDAKDKHFAPERRVAFRYAVSGISPGENTCANGTKPGGKAEIGGNDLIVYSTDPGIVVHELGHTLNLGHGGFEGLNNKPNYLSIMNYNYGLDIPQVSGGGLLDYSPPLCPGCPGGRGAIPDDLDETQLDETEVLDANDGENMFQYRDLLAITQGGPASGNDTDSDGTPDIDWDGDGVVSNAPVIVDVNEDGKCVEPGVDNTPDTLADDDDQLLSDDIIHDGLDRECDTAKNPASDDVQKRAVGTGQPDILASYDDWSEIKLNFREFGDAADGPLNPVETERTLAAARAQAQEINTTDLSIEKSDSPDPVNADAPLTYQVTILNQGPQPARGIRVLDSLSPQATYISDTGGCLEAPAGTLTCELPTLLQGESDAFEVTVVYEADAVADLPAPATVENIVSVQNRVPYGLDGALGEVGGDPDQTNDSDVEETVINRPPVADPNGPYVEECQGAATTVALDGSASYDPDGDPISYLWSSDCPGASFDDAASATPMLTVTSPPPCPVQCTATLTVTDPMNLSDTEGTGVTIEDTTPPTINVMLDPSELWPPNHKLKIIQATVVAADICDSSPEVELVSVVSDEPDNGKGDGNTVDDIQEAALGTEDYELKVRSERSGKGDGRTYTVTYRATDDCGLSTEGSATVKVPHNP